MGSLMDMLGAKPNARYALYTRVSSEEQVQGYSLDAQMDVLKQFVESRGGTVVATYSDPARSGKTALRPEFQRMIHDAEAGAFDVIAVHKLDRFSRSLLDTLAYLKRLNDVGVSFVSATEQFDFTSPVGKVVLALLASFAEWYLDNLAAEVRKGKIQRVSEGYHNGTLSWGYTTLKRLREQLLDVGAAYKAGTVDEQTYAHRAQHIERALMMYEDVIDTAAIPDPFDAPGVTRAFQLYGTGLYSDRDIAHMLNESGYRILTRPKSNPEGLFSANTVGDVLQNRFYVGQVSYGVRVPGKARQWMDGKHQPIVAQNLFDRCQSVRMERSARFVPTPPRRYRDYILSSVLTCECCNKRWGGWLIHGEPRYRDMADPRRGQTCTARIKSAPAEDFEVEIGEFVRSLRLPRTWRSRIESMLAVPTDTEALKQGRRKLERQLQRLQKLFTLGDLDEATYQRQRDDVRKKLDEMVILSPNISQLLMLGDSLDRVDVLWDAATAQEKRAMIEMLFAKIYVRDGAIHAAEPTGILWTLLDELLIRGAGRKGIFRLARIWIVPPNTPIEDIQNIA